MDSVSNAPENDECIDALTIVGGFTKSLIWWLDMALGTIRRAHASAVSHSVRNLSGDWQFMEACTKVFVSEYFINNPTNKNCTSVQWVDVFKVRNIQREHLPLRARYLGCREQSRRSA